MSAKIVNFIDKTITANTGRFDAEGRPVTQEINLFVQYAGFIIENVALKNETDTFLAHSIREKIDSVNGLCRVELEETEVTFLRKGIEKLQEQDRVTGTNWYYVVKALREAEDKKTFERKQKASEGKK